jgi:hypothetical protein
LLRQLGNCQFHGARNWDASNAFVLVDPSVGSQSLGGVIARGFQIFHALFRSRFFVIASTRRRPNYREDDYTKKSEKKDDPEPRGQRRSRVNNLAKRFGVSHFS